MKKYSRYNLILGIGVLWCISCSKKEDNNNLTQPVITSIVPSSAHGGDTITAYVKNLETVSDISVSINNKPAEIITVSDESIQAVVPLKAGSGKVMLRYGGMTYAGPEFQYEYQAIVSTFAGSGRTGDENGQGYAASFYCPRGIAIDSNGDLFIADSYNRLIRKISADKVVSSFTIPVLIGSSNFYSPYNIAINPLTHDLFVTDFNEHVMRMDPAGNMEVILTDTMPLTGIAVSPDGENLFISNNSLATIIKTDINGKNQSIFTSGLYTPRNIIFSKEGKMFVAAYPASIYEISTVDGKASPVATDPTFRGWEIAIDTSGNFYLADYFSNVIRKIDKSGNASTIAGNGIAADIDGIGPDASFDGPQGIAIDAEGNLYVSTFNYSTATGNRVRKVTFQ